MDFTLALVIATVAIALFFDYTNGFHDAANAIATSVSTRALTPRLALTMAAILNFVGALLGVEVAKTIKDILTGFDDIDSPNHALTIVVSRAGRRHHLEPHHLVLRHPLVVLARAHRRTRRRRPRRPASRSTGTRSSRRSPSRWSSARCSASRGAFLVMLAIMWIFRRARPQPVNRGFRLSQTVSAAMLSLGHGLQDAQKTMGVIVLALIAGGYGPGDGRARDPALGDPRGRDGHLARHVLRRHAHHAHDGPPHHRARPARAGSRPS